MKLFTREAWTGILTAFVGLVGLILKVVLPPEAGEIIAPILTIVEAVGLILIWIFGRQTARALRTALSVSNTSLRGALIVSREGTTGLLTALLTVIGLLLNMLLPPEMGVIIPYILAIVEAVGLILIWVFGRQTAQALGL